MTGAEYKQRREALGLTQAALAELLEVHTITIAKREAGTHQVSREMEYALNWIASQKKKSKKN